MFKRNFKKFRSSFTSSKKAEEAKFTSQDETTLLLRFNDLDKDQNGILSKEEVRRCFTELGFDRYFVKTFMERFDINKDGFVSLEEFKSVIGYIPETQKQCNMWRHTFEEIDKDKSGKISVHELVQLLNEVGFGCKQSDVEKLLEDNGFIIENELTYETFLELMTKIA